MCVRSSMCVHACLLASVRSCVCVSVHLSMCLSVYCCFSQSNVALVSHEKTHWPHLHRHSYGQRPEKIYRLFILFYASCDELIHLFYISRSPPFSLLPSLIHCLSFSLLCLSVTTLCCFREDIALSLRAAPVSTPCPTTLRLSAQS